MPHPISAGGTYSRKPAHQNSFAFRHNAKSKLTDKILASPIVNVCVPCSEKLEWRKKYRKYKPLTQPAVCNDCKMKRITAAYHTICTPCAAVRKAAPGNDGKDVCEICLNKNDEFRKEGIIKDTSAPDGMSANQLKKRAEEEEELRGLRERERRAVLRKKEKEERINAKKDRKARRMAAEGGGAAADGESSDDCDDSGVDDDFSDDDDDGGEFGVGVGGKAYAGGEDDYSDDDDDDDGQVLGGVNLDGVHEVVGRALKAGSAGEAASDLPPPTTRAAAEGGEAMPPTPPEAGSAGAAATSTATTTTSNATTTEA